MKGLRVETWYKDHDYCTNQSYTAIDIPRNNLLLGFSVELSYTACQLWMVLAIIDNVVMLCFDVMSDVCSIISFQYCHYEIILCSGMYGGTVYSLE